MVKRHRVIRHCLLLALLLAGQVAASEIRIKRVAISQQGPFWLVQPEIQWQVDQPVIDAIHSGVALRFQLKGRLVEQRPFWWDSGLARHSQNLEVRYFSLSKQYLLKNLDSGQQRGFLRLDNLWQQLGQLTPLQLPLNPRANAVQLRLRLDTGALPAAMQLPTLLNSAWRLDSGWQSFPLPGTATKTEKQAPAP
jgi:hypothetical protein